MRDALIHQYLGRVHLIASRLKRNLPPCFEVHDLEQAGVVALLERAEFYQPDLGSFWPFVRDRVHGAMLDFVRSEWKDVCHVELTPVRVIEDVISSVSCPPVNGHVRELQSADPNPEELAVEDERRRILRRLMLRLTHKQRVVIDRRLAGEKHSEIARSLRVNIVTTKVLQHQAVKKMQEVA